MMRQPTAILENTFSIGYEKTFNQLWSASFSLPLDDPKNEYCKALNYVEIYDEDEYIGLFRIVPKKTEKNESSRIVTYTCEHVLATLLDKSIFKYVQRDNWTTTQVLNFLINMQNTKHWKLGKVDFTRRFSYKWENDNLLSAIFSVPKPFDVQYQWTWDTQSYPWTLNLVAPETKVTCEIRERKNLVGLEIEENPLGIFNRIYPLGYGEGDNQLTIESVNNGIPYIQDDESVDMYGIREYIWADKRFESAATLKASTVALLKSWKEPEITWSTTAADISKITGLDIYRLKMGRIVRLNVEGIPVVDLRIFKESKSDIKGDPGKIELEIGNLLGDLTNTQADLQRRQQINELYAQGATNIDSHDYCDNADSNNPVVIRFYLPEEMVRVNKALLTYETTEFRSYGKATEGGGATAKTTEGGGGTTATSTSGGGTTATSTSGGGVAKSTDSGGGSSQTSSAGGNHVHKMFDYVGDSSGVSNPLREFTPQGGLGFRVALQAAAPANLITAEGSGNHQHSVNIPAHSHEFNIPNHSHQVTIPNHSHQVTIPNHSHEFSIPNHVHEIAHGIYKMSSVPSQVTIKIDGNTVPGSSNSGENVDIIPYLQTDSEGKVVRGWHTIEIKPNGLGRINAQVTTQFFIQSRGGGSF